jgi:hypothetical protein
MAFSRKLPNIPQDKVLFMLALIAFIGLFALTNHMLEKQPERDTQMVGMATLKGHGHLLPLHEAMNRDGDLTAMVGTLSARPATDMFLNRTAVDQAMADILFRWSGSDVIPAESFGPFIDSRVAGFLQAIGSIPLEATGTVISAEESSRLVQVWFRAFDHFRLRLLGQTLGKKIFIGGLVYDIGSDSLNTPEALNERFMVAFNQELQGSVNSGEAIRNLLDFIDQTKGFGNLSEAEQDLIMGMDVKPQEPVAGEQVVSAPGSPAVPLPEQAGSELVPPVGPSSNP